MFLVTSQQSQELDGLSEKFGVSTTQLMENAGIAIAEVLMQKTTPKEGSIVFFLGKGNNGGDGLVAAKCLEAKKYSVIIIRDSEDLKEKSKELKKAIWIVDALLGTGLKGEVKGWIREAIEVINQSGKKILSIDIPSGLSTDKGVPLGAAVKATLTVCLGNAKLGAVLSPGLDYAGEIQCADIGIPKEVSAKISLPFHLLEPKDFKSYLIPRLKDSHKKDFGHVLVVAGSKGMPGAGFLASMAALRSGAGLVTYALPEKAFEKFEPQYAEVMVASVPDEGNGFFGKKSLDKVLQLCGKKQVVLLGPGLGRSKETIAFVQTLVSQIKPPLVLDADGLFCMSSHPGLLKKRSHPTVLTPHPGEMANLLGWQTEEVQRARVQVALDGAKSWGASLILKGFRTLVAFPDGNLYVNPTGNPGMATAGSGDVLAGVVAGFIAQGLSVEASALAGVYLHGLAGDMAREELGEKGLIASDVTRCIPKAIRLIEQTS